jgi:hypothetical protein
MFVIVWARDWAETHSYEAFHDFTGRSTFTAEEYGKIRFHETTLSEGCANASA